MTVNSQTNKTVALGDGVETQFAFGFIGVAAAYISVIYTDPSGNEDVLVEGSGATQYQIALNPPVAGALWGLGGQVTYNPSGTPIPPGSTLTIFRTLPLTQAISLQRLASLGTLGNGAETGLDILTMQLQQVGEVSGRAILMNPSNSRPPLPLPPAANIAGLGAIFSPDGLDMVAGQAPANGFISSVMQPVVGASSLANGRTAFGLGNVATLNVGSGLSDDGNGDLRTLFPIVQVSTNQTPTPAAHLNKYEASGALTFALARANSYFPGFGFWVDAITHSITLTIDSHDVFGGTGVLGAPVTIPAGSVAFVKTDGSATGNWWLEICSNNPNPVERLGNIYAADYGFATGNTPAANKTALDAAVSAASAQGGGKVMLPRGRFQCNNLFTIEANNVVLVGQGDFSGGTELQCMQATGDFIVFNGTGQMGIVNCYLSAGVKRTSGRAIVVIGGAFQTRIQQVRIDYHYDGIWIGWSSETFLLNVTFRYMLGGIGLQFYSTSLANGVFRVTVIGIRADNPYPISNNSPRKSWAASTPFSAGDIVAVNGGVYQCTQSGTSGGSGPSGTPGTGGNTAFTTPIADGSCQWMFVCNGGLTWIVQDSFAYSISINGGAVLDAVNGFSQRDQLATGSSAPVWCWAWDLEIDHALNDCVILIKGRGFFASSCWFGSSLTASGINIFPTHTGEVSISGGTEISGHWQDGILLQDGPVGVTIMGNTFNSNSQGNHGNYNAVTVAAGAASFAIVGNMVGQLGSDMGYGVNVAAGGSDNYVIALNVIQGSTLGTVSDGGTGTNKYLAGNIA